jgi:hypothetical protein
MRLEGIVWDIEKKSVKEVISALNKRIAGDRSCENEWVFESIIYRKSRLIRTWYELSMDSSL